MATAKQLNQQLAIPASEAFKNLNGNLIRSGWEVFYRNEIRDSNGGDIKEIFGVSDSVSGSNIFSLFMQGVRYVPFFAKISSIDGRRSEVMVVAAGSEELLGFDFGRNKGVAEKVIDWCQKRSCGV